MSVTPLDPPDTELAHGRYEAIDFTIDTDPAETIVAVRFDDLGTWEVACWEGTFAEQYALASSLAGSTYSLVRTDGWPAAPSAYVKEQEAAPTTFWTTLLDIDLTAQGSQTILASGVGTSAGRDAVATIAGKTFNVRVRSIDGLRPVSAVLTNGVGLVLECNNSSWAGGNIDASCLHIDYATQVPGWDVSKPTALLARFSGGVFNATQGGMGVASLDFRTVATHMGGGVNFNSGSPFLYNVSGAILKVSEIALATSLEYTMAIVRSAATQAHAFQLPWAGSLPSIEEMLPIAELSYPAKTMATGGAVYLSGGFGQTTSITIKRLQVLQK